MDDSAKDLTEAVIITSLLKEFPIMISKSQLPDAKRRKAEAVSAILEKIKTSIGSCYSEKQLLKKIANMKTRVKTKSDANATGNRPISLLPWEAEFRDILKADSNPSFSRTPGALAVGAGASFSGESPPQTVRQPSCAATSSSTGGKVQVAVQRSNMTTSRKRKLACETAETQGLSNVELQRLVLLEQLSYIREKKRRLWQVEPSHNPAVGAQVGEGVDSFYDCADNEQLFSL